MRSGTNKVGQRWNHHDGRYCGWREIENSSVGLGSSRGRGRQWSKGTTTTTITHWRRLEIRSSGTKELGLGLQAKLTLSTWKASLSFSLSSSLALSFQKTINYYMGWLIGILALLPLLELSFGNTNQPIRRGHFLQLAPTKLAQSLGAKNSWQHFKNFRCTIQRASQFAQLEKNFSPIWSSALRSKKYRIKSGKRYHIFLAPPSLVACIMVPLLVSVPQREGANSTFLNMNSSSDRNLVAELGAIPTSGFGRPWPIPEASWSWFNLWRENSRKGSFPPLGTRNNGWAPKNKAKTFFMHKFPDKTLQTILSFLARETEESLEQISDLVPWHSCECV